MNVKELIESVKVWEYPLPLSFQSRSMSLVEKSDFDRVVEELTKWNKVEDELPEFNKTVNVRFTVITGEIMECTARLENIPRHNFENPPMDKRWFVFPSSKHEITGRVIEWRYIY